MSIEHEDLRSKQWNKQKDAATPEIVMCRDDLLEKKGEIIKEFKKEIEEIEDQLGLREDEKASKL